MRKRLKILAGLVLIFSIIFSGTLLAEDNINLTAESVVLMDAKSGKVLYSKDMNKMMYPASTTKIITALVLLDHFAPEALVRVGSEINSVPADSSKAGHVINETITVENLVRGLIIPSGNDTAAVVAAAVAKRYKNDETLSYIECERVFAELMNQKAKELGAENTNFTNPHGYHDANHYSTAYDIALFSKAAIENEIISSIAAETAFYGDGAGNSLESSSTMITQTYSWSTHNLLMSKNSTYYYPSAKGIKTGFTDEAGDCLAAYAKEDRVELISVVLKDKDPYRWYDSQSLFDYGFDNFSYMNIQEPNEIVGEAPLIRQDPFGPSVVEAYALSEKELLLSESEFEAISSKIELKSDICIIEDDKYFIKAPVTKDMEIGTIKYMLNGEIIYEDTVYAASDIEKSNIFKDLAHTIISIPSNITSPKGFVPLIIIIVIAAIIVLIIRNKIRRKLRRIYRTRRRK